VILLASGTELALAREARMRLEADGTPTRVVSLPSWYLFAQQERTYRDAVLPPSVTRRISVEAAATFGWERWIGLGGRAVGLDRFGASAPAEVLFEKLGVTADAVVEAAKHTS
jgi:transketolase